MACSIAALQRTLLLTCRPPVTRPTSSLRQLGYAARFAADGRGAGESAAKARDAKSTVLVRRRSHSTIFGCPPNLHLGVGRG